MAKRGKRGGGSRRKRVSRDYVRKNAKEQSTSSWQHFRLPKGVGEWSPTKAGRYDIDIIPYEVVTAGHPDGIEPGCLWFRFPYKVHRGVGPNDDTIVCPTSIGKPCFICKTRVKLAKDDYESNEEQIKALTPQRWVAYNILDPEDPDKIVVFAMSRGKFAQALEQEIEEGDEDILNFYDVTSDGKTLRVRFSDAQYKGRTYQEATRIDFRERGEMDEDEIVEKTVCFEDCIIILPGDKLRTLFLQVEEEEEDEPKEASEEDNEPEEDNGPEEKDEPEEEEPEEDNEPEEDEPPKTSKKGKKSAKKSTKKKDEPGCPAGGTFGKDNDKHDECDNCEDWEACVDAQEGA